MSDMYRRYFKNLTLCICGSWLNSLYEAVVLCLVLEFKVNMADSQEEMILNRVENGQAGIHEDELKLCLFLLLGLQI